MKRNNSTYDINKFWKYLLYRIILALLICVIFIPVSYSQSPILDKEYQFLEQSVTIKKFLNDLSKVGGFTFSYGKEVPLDKKVRIKPIKQSIKKHLDHIFSGESFEYIEKDNKILIISVSPESKSLLPSQTIRGRVIDLDSKTPLVGVNILLGSDDPLIGTISDENGYYKFENVPIGRHDLIFSSIAYESKYISNFLVGSGKEMVVTVEMEEAIVQIDELKVISKPNKSNPINDLTTVSGRSFSAYEIESYPGSMSDISRAAISFPGVLSTNDGQNHIVIRGNSPKGLQWRLEGIEIPNLNHFSNIGASGGGVGIISNNMISGSDFITSAFPAEYGNALSGVFDLRFRSGNSEKHEQTFQLGLIGTELMLEGPLKKNTNTTYIAHYRYSTFKLIQKMGAQLPSVPDFQDISFKIYHPTKKMGVFSLFGIGGLSHEEGQNGYIMNSNMATLGLSNYYTINQKTFLKSVVALSGWNYTWDEESDVGTEFYPVNHRWETDVKDYTIKSSFSINRKLNSKHKIKAGLIYEMAFNDSYIGWFSDTLFNWYNDPENPYFENLNYEDSYVDANTRAATFQSYLNWKYRIAENFTFNTGLHFIQFYLNNNFSIEPRIGLQWKAHPRHIFSAGFGVHSRKESMTLYTGSMTQDDGEVIQPNLGLELTKARHYVIGYNFHMNEYLNLKAEAYYQSLYDIPAHPFPPYISSINFDYGFEGNILENYGTAYNKGLELILEKHLSRGYHFLLTGTIYESKYKNKLGENLHTRYDGKYASNGLLCKEFNIGKEGQNIISIGTRYILFGGMRYLPIDVEQSIIQDREVVLWENGYSEKASDYFRVDLQLSFTRNHANYTGIWSFDIMNLTNHKNLRYEYWDSSVNDLRNEYQNPIIPFINYKLQF